MADDTELISLHEKLTAALAHSSDGAVSLPIIREMAATEARTLQGLAAHLSALAALAGCDEPGGTCEVQIIRQMRDTVSFLTEVKPPG